MPRSVKNLDQLFGSESFAFGSWLFSVNRERKRMFKVAFLFLMSGNLLAVIIYFESPMLSIAKRHLNSSWGDLKAIFKLC